MIIAESGGGLGNQLNIYATARALAIKKNLTLKIDSSFYDSWPRRKDAPRTFQLNNFKIPLEIASKKEVRNYLIKTHIRPIDKIFRKFRLFEKKVLEEGKEFNEGNFFSISEKDFYLRGYFGIKYFDLIKPTLLKEICLKKNKKIKIKAMINRIMGEDSVSINVRRGDLLSLGFYVLPLEYYKTSFEKINKSLKKPKYYVFSDDIKWCKENFKFISGAIFVEGTEAYEDLELMKNCKHNILANSALSWWAAYLNKNKNKIVICPKYFTHFLPKNPNDYKDKNPKEWIRL